MSTETAKNSGGKTRSLRVRKAAARTAVAASTRTGDILPRKIYELADAPVPENATDELQEAS